MMPMNLILALVTFLSMQATSTQPDFSGDWVLASGTTNMSRSGGPGPTSTFLSEGSAFNCGRGCRLVHKGSTLTIDNAQLKTGAAASSPAVSIPIDGQSHEVVDSVDLGKTIQTIGRWDGSKLVITSMLLGIPITQTLSLENGQLVVVRPYVSSNAVLTLRYAKK